MNPGDPIIVKSTPPMRLWELAGKRGVILAINPDGDNPEWCKVKLDHPSLLETKGCHVSHLELAEAEQPTRILKNESDFLRKRSVGDSAFFLSGHTRRMVLLETGIDKNTAWTLGKRIREAYGTILCQCGKISGHKGWCGFMISKLGCPWKNQLKDISSFNIYVPTCPRYERREIPNERETEIFLLVNQRHIRSFEAPLNGYDDETLHFFISRGDKTPLEALIEKEDFMTGEATDRCRRINEWERWVERKTSAFHIK